MMNDLITWRKLVMSRKLTVVILFFMNVIKMIYAKNSVIFIFSFKNCDPAWQNEAEVVIRKISDIS